MTFNQRDKKNHLKKACLKVERKIFDLFSDTKMLTISYDGIPHWSSSQKSDSDNPRGVHFGIKKKRREEKLNQHRLNFSP